MNKGLDLIKRRQLEFINDFPTGNISIGVTKEELTELENELKALEIIKRNPMLVIHLLINNATYQYVVETMNENERPTQKEWDLLTEVLL